MPRYLLAPSILSADFGHLADAVRAVEPHADLIHVDVMDGHFVPPITIGPVVVASLRKVTSLPLECHLMVDLPAEQTEQFAEAGASSVVVHIEAAPEPRPVLQRARDLKLGTGLSLNPPTPLEDVLPYLEDIDVLNVMTVNPGWAGQAFIPEMLSKIATARAEIDRRGLDVLIAVDGGINMETGRRCLEAGVNVLGAATAIFGRPDVAVAAAQMKQMLRERASGEVA